VAGSIERVIVEIAIQFTAYGQQRAANELTKQGIIISPGGVRSVWLRSDLETFMKRLKVLEAKVGGRGANGTANRLKDR
jgi:hypothetical protein